MTDLDITRALVEQVLAAANGKPEYTVTTVLTKGMWKAFLRGAGAPVNSEPNQGVSVFGSKTIVLNRKGMGAVSFRRR